MTSDKQKIRTIGPLRISSDSYLKIHSKHHFRETNFKKKTFSKPQTGFFFSMQSFFQCVQTVLTLSPLISSMFVFAQLWLKMNKHHQLPDSNQQHTHTCTPTHTHTHLHTQVRTNSLPTITRTLSPSHKQTQKISHLHIFLSFSFTTF